MMNVFCACGNPDLSPLYSSIQIDVERERKEIEKKKNFMKEWKWKALPPTQSATVIPLRPHLWNIGKYANHDGNSNEIAPDKSWCGQDPLLGTMSLGHVRHVGT